MADDKTFTKADIDAAVAAAMGPVNDKIEELQNKNTGLMDDLKKAQREARAAKEIKPEDMQAAEERADKAEAALADATKALKTATGERDKATKALETEQGFTHKLLIQDGIRAALIEAGVKDADYLDMALAKLSSGAIVKIDGDTREAMIGEKPLADFIKDWAATDAGKKVIAAPENGGGGILLPRGGKVSGKTMSESDFNALPPKGRSEFMAEGGSIAE